MTVISVSQIHAFIDLKFAARDAEYGHSVVDGYVRQFPNMAGLGMEIAECAKCGYAARLIFPIPARFPQDCPECGSKGTMWLGTEGEAG